jgi:hypothetical protein
VSVWANEILHSFVENHQPDPAATSLRPLAPLAAAMIVWSIRRTRASTNG